MLCSRFQGDTPAHHTPGVRSFATLWSASRKLRCTGVYAGACSCACRGAFGAAPPLLLRDASAACLAQAVAGLVDPKGSGHAAAAAAAAARVPPELATAQGPQELAAVLRAMTGEADKEPGKHPAKPSNIAVQKHRLATVLRTA